MEHLPVDNYGNCFHNVDMPVTRGRGDYQTVKEEVLKQYKFAVAFENKVLENYVTEKVYNALSAGSIPIYLGAPDIMKHVPSGSIINAADFSGPAALAQHIQRVASDPALYASYFDWDKRELDRLAASHSCMHNWYCQVCELMAYERAKRHGRPAPEPWGGNKQKWGHRRG